MAKILLIEDNQDKRKEYTLSLENAGFEVIACPGGSEIGSLVDNNNFDGVLSDSDLGPNQDEGYRVIEDLKKKGKLEHKLIVGMSNQHDELDNWKGIAFWTLYKPGVPDMGKCMENIYSNWEMRKNG